MSRHSTTIASLAAITLLGLTGCASSDGTNTEEPSGENKPSGALANLDTCKIMTQQQLDAGGFVHDRREDTLPFEPGCGYSNDKVSMAIYKNQRETVQSYKKNRNLSEFNPMKINDRDGAQTNPPGAMEDMCSTLIPAGGGIIIVNTQSGDVLNPIDGCAESMKIAQQIEPNLPE